MNRYPWWVLLLAAIGYVLCVFIIVFAVVWLLR